MDKKDNIFTTDWWMPEKKQRKNRFQYFNQQNPINVYEYLNTNLEKQNEMIERLERIEKKLDDLTDKVAEKEND